MAAKYRQPRPFHDHDCLDRLAVDIGLCVGGAVLHFAAGNGGASLGSSSLDSAPDPSGGVGPDSGPLLSGVLSEDYYCVGRTALVVECLGACAGYCRVLPA